MIAREIRCDRNRADGCGDSRGHASLPSAQPVRTDPRIAGLLGVCGASWKRGGKEAVTGIQCNSIVCKATCPAALRQKERNRIAFATAERMMDLSGWRMSAKNSEHTDPIEELGEGELVNQSATHSLLHACASHEDVWRSALTPSPGVLHRRQPRLVWSRWTSFLHSLIAGSFRSAQGGFVNKSMWYFSFRFSLKGKSKNFQKENIRVILPKII